MNKITLYLLRHGKTYCNEKSLYCGISDVSLSDSGIEELKQIKKEILIPNCEFYFTSGLKRANETLEILTEKKEYLSFKELSEYNFGKFELKSYEELKNMKEYLNWIEDKEGNAKCPKGESKIEYKNRIKAGFIKLIEYLKKEKINTAFGVIHGGSIGNILQIFYDNRKNFYEWQPKNGKGYKIIIQLEDYKKFKIEKIFNI